MNVLLLIFSYNTGGIERLLIDTANGLSKRGYHVSLCIINDAYDTELLYNFDVAVHIHYLNRPKHSRKRVSFMMQFVKIIRAEHIQLIHCQDLNCVIFSSLAKLLCPSVIILDTVHDTMVYKTYSALQIIFERFLCRRIIAISCSVQKEIRDRNIPFKKIVLIYNAIDTSNFPLLPKHCIVPDQITLGNVARIQPAVKGQLVLLQAITILKSKYPHILCKFAGGIAPTDESDYQALLQFVDANALQTNVTFLGNVKDVPSFLRSVDIFILPSLYEGFGISLIEAMSMGLPCIASNLDGPAEIINNTSYGLLFNPGDAIDLAQKIDYAIEHYDDFDNSIISDSISARFGIEIMLDQLTALYQQLLN